MAKLTTNELRELRHGIVTVIDLWLEQIAAGERVARDGQVLIGPYTVDLWIELKDAP